MSIQNRFVAIFATLGSAAVAQSTVFVAAPSADTVYVIPAGGGAASALGGVGPAYLGILDISSAPDGSLYVLDGEVASMRILSVDPITGDRAVVTELPGTDWLPMFWATGANEFHLLKTSSTGETPFNGTLWTLYRVTPGTLLSSPIETPVGTRENPSPPLAGTISTGGLRLLLSSAAGEQFAETDGVTLLDAPAIPRYRTTTIVPGTPPVEFEGTISIPAGVSSPVWRIVLDVETTSASFANRIRFYTAAPGRAQTIQDTMFKRGLPDNTAPFIWRIGCRVDVDTLSPQDGDWTIGYTPSSFSSYAPQSLTLYPDYYRTAYRIAEGPGGELWVLEANPPRATRVDTTNGAPLVQMPLLPHPASGIDTAQLSHLQDFRIAANGRAYVTLFDDGRVLELDLGSGQLSVLNPAGLPPSGRGGPPPEPQTFRIALANGAPAGADGWMIYQ